MTGTDPVESPGNTRWKWQSVLEALGGERGLIYILIYILIFERAYLLLHTQNHLKCFFWGFFGQHCGVWLRHWYWDTTVPSGSLVHHNYSPWRWRGTFEGHAPSTRRPNYCLMNHQISFPCANYSDTSSKFRKMTACCTAKAALTSCHPQTLRSIEAFTWLWT